LKHFITTVFLAPLTLALLIVLLINDHILKGFYPSFLTGKLSDLSGIYIMNLLLFSALLFIIYNLKNLFYNNKLSSTPDNRNSHNKEYPIYSALLISSLLTLLFFLLLKTYSPMKDLYDFFMVSIWGKNSIGIIQDPADLFTLFILVVQYIYFLSLYRKAFPHFKSNKPARVKYKIFHRGSFLRTLVVYCVFGLCIFSLLATSTSDDDPEPQTESPDCSDYNLTQEGSLGYHKIPTETDNNTVRYRGYRITQKTDEENYNQILYFPLTNDSKLIRASITRESGYPELDITALVNTSGEGVFEWTSKTKASYTTFSPKRIRLAENGTILYVLGNARLAIFTESTGERLFTIPPVGTNLPENERILDFYLTADYIYLYFIDDTDEKNFFRRYNINDGSFDAIVGEINFPGLNVNPDTGKDINPDTNRDIKFYPSFIFHNSGFARVGKFTPLLEGEKLFILEGFQSDLLRSLSFDSDLFLWGHFLAEFSLLDYRNGKVILIGRERNYQRIFYIIDPSSGETLSLIGNEEKIMDAYYLPPTCSRSGNLSIDSEDLLSIHRINNVEGEFEFTIFLYVWQNQLEFFLTEE
jgi:hypothetical protein